MPAETGPHVHTVLIVDDELSLLRATAFLLESCGCNVTTADSGPAALQAFATGLRPCMVLLDLRMPDMDGWEVWDQLRAHPEYRLTPVVAYTAQPPDHHRARAVGLRGVVQKARPATELLAAIEQHCRVAAGD